MAPEVLSPPADVGLLSSAIGRPSRVGFPRARELQRRRRGKEEEEERKGPGRGVKRRGRLGHKGPSGGREKRRGLGCNFLFFLVFTNFFVFSFYYLFIRKDKT